MINLNLSNNEFVSVVSGVQVLAASAQQMINNCPDQQEPEFQADLAEYRRKVNYYDSLVRKLYAQRRKQINERKASGAKQCIPEESRATTSSPNKSV